MTDPSLCGPPISCLQRPLQVLPGRFTMRFGSGVARRESNIFFGVLLAIVSSLISTDTAEGLQILTYALSVVASLSS